MRPSFLFSAQAASNPTATPPFVGLDERYADYLASLNESPAAISDGVQVGQQAAAALLTLRANDGVVGVNTYVFQTPGPGVYQPTPPFPYAGPQTPWIANMTPFTMSTPAQFLPDEGPTPLSTQEWADDYNRTKTLGSLTSTVRTPEQTTIALFWTANPGAAFNSMLTDLVSTRSLDTLDSARLFAMVFTGYGDGFIGCTNAKYHFNFWRPVTAIQEGDTDGNPDTIADPNWLPLATTPNHPEYPAAHGCVTGAVTSVVASYFGAPNLTLHVTVTYAIPGSARRRNPARNPHLQQHERPAARGATGSNLRRHAFPPLRCARHGAWTKGRTCVGERLLSAVEVMA